MDALQTFHDLLEETGLRDSREYVSADSKTISPRERHFLEWGKNKIGAEGVVLQRIPMNDSCFPLAYFRRLEDASPSKIADVHKLAWNMGRAPLIFIVLPGKVLVHSTYERPRPRPEDRSLHEKAGLIDTIDMVTAVEGARQTLQKYRREELLSGRLWERQDIRKHFRQGTWRVEKSLLDNLSAIRSLLVKSLPDQDRSRAVPIVHALLGRAIFIQYLQDRKDSKGYCAFPQDYFDQFSPGAKCFPEVLSNKRATYKLFDALEKKFNGDVFPITRTERKIVEQEHLTRLAEFLRGDITIRNRQLSFWPYYSFDAIPIEFISNMYEEFFHYEKEEQVASRQGRAAKKPTGTHYTPQRLVEFVLDEVLPWEGTNTEVRVLDPACGSGIFLVEAYRRLVGRWRQANPGKSIDARSLKTLLVSNLHGVDHNPEAVRVAAFSLYLTMCDYLEPRHVWTSVKFPALRNRNLWDEDFFAFADGPHREAGSFDLVVGNPPWESDLSPHAERYVQEHKLPVGDRQIAQVFLWAAPRLCKDHGKVCLIAPSKGLLFNASGPNREFRRKFFETFTVNLIVNLSALRKNLFAKAVGPAAPIVYEPKPPDDHHRIVYCCPKPSNSAEDGWHYVIENTDVCQIPWRKAAEHEFIWKTAMWGGPRDWELVQKLAALPSLRQVADQRGWTHGEGFIVGTRTQQTADWLTGKPHVAAHALQPFAMDESSLPHLDETLFYRAANTKRSIFKGPHLLVGQSPKAGKGFVAALLQRDAVFSHSLLGISSEEHDKEILGAACAAFASDISAYFAMMTSSRWLVERDELDKHEIMRLPLPRTVKEGDLRISYSQLQAAARAEACQEELVKRISTAYGLSPSERTLIRDAVTCTLDYFSNGAKSEAMKETDDHMLRKYASTLSVILHTSFGASRKRTPRARIYLGDSPMVVLEVILTPERGQQRPEILRADDRLSQALRMMDTVLLEKWSSGVYVRRDVHVYQDNTLYIAKRNQRRLWTESAAMRDADEIYGEVMRTWEQQAWE